LAASPQLHTESLPTDERARPWLLPPIKGAKRTIVILSLALASCRGPIVPATPTASTVSLRLLADSSTSPLLRDLVANYRPAHSVIAWDIKVGESSTVVGWLKQGEASYALMDYPPADSLDKPLWSTPVGQNGLAMVVNPGNPVSNLTAAQLRSILQGRIVDWTQVGGSGQALTVVAQPDHSSATSLIQSMVMGDRRITRAARLAPTSEAVIDIVSTDPGAIGYVSVGYLDNRVRAVALDGIQPTPDTLTNNQYPLRIPILFVGLQAPGNDAYRDFFIWVQSPGGQAIVRQHYGALASQ
jgi:phosphate transport system substrate-binding protein